jgi:hydrogenase maturation protease
VIAELDGHVPSAFTLVGTEDMATSLLDAMLNHSKVIVLDEVRCGSPAGTIYRLTAEQYSTLESPERLLHELSLANVVELARAFGISSEVVVFGVEPADSDRTATGVDEAIVRATAAVVTAELGLPRAETTAA